MRLAICLFKFFKYGGLARDFLNITNICVDRGYSVTVFAMEWHGETPKHFNIKLLPAKHWKNHIRTKIYIEKLEKELSFNKFDLVFGFNKIPNLDIYYAADSCYIERTLGCGRFLYRMGGRYKYYSYCEKTVFSKESKTVSLMISKIQMCLFKKHYQTPSQRMLLLPPGISKDRIAPSNAAHIRTNFRATYNISDDEKILLMVGTAFKTKGLDRTLKAMSLMPEKIKRKVKLFVVGEGNIKPFQKMAKKFGLQTNVTFFGGRDDVPLFLLGADLLLQPSYHESAGIAIIEAIVSGLPVLVSDVCGYAFHAELAKAGIVLPNPFNIQQFARNIEYMLMSPKRKQWIRNAYQYAQSEDLYSMPERAVDYVEQIAERKMRANAG